MSRTKLPIAVVLGHNDPMRQDHDASYKQLFSYPEVVRDLVLGFIPDPWLQGLDFSTLQKVPGSFVTDDLRHRASDVVWRVRVGEQWMYLYLLIEFQSGNDRWMAVRMMTYVGLLYQDLIRQGHGRRRCRRTTRKKQNNSTATAAWLPPILPIVIYNGPKRWTAATDIAELVPQVPGRVADYLPRMKYLLIDESTLAQRAGTFTLTNLMAAMVGIEFPTHPDLQLQIITHLDSWLNYNPELRRTLAIWIRSVILRQTSYRVALPPVTDLKELKMTVANRFDQWTREWQQQGLEKGRQLGMREGMEKGIEKGEALLLQRQLARRFGPLPDDVLQRITHAGTAQLELWGDRVLDANTLQEVFAPSA